MNPTGHEYGLGHFSRPIYGDATYPKTIRLKEWQIDLLEKIAEAEKTDLSRVIQSVITEHRIGLEARAGLRAPVEPEQKGGAGGHAAGDTHSTNADRSAEPASGGGGHAACDTQSAAAPAAASPEPPVKAGEGAGHSTLDAQSSNARPEPTRPKAPPQRNPSPAFVAARLAAKARGAQTIFDTYETEIGKPIGDCTKEDLTNLSRKAGHKMRLYGKLASRLSRSDAKVRDEIKVETFTNLMNEAWEEGDDR